MRPSFAYRNPLRLRGKPILARAGLDRFAPGLPPITGRGHLITCKRVQHLHTSGKCRSVLRLLPGALATRLTDRRAKVLSDLRMSAIDNMSSVRSDLIEKVTGRAEYVTDLTVPGMLHGFVVRSPAVHARIASIDSRVSSGLPTIKPPTTSMPCRWRTSTAATAVFVRRPS